MKDWSIHTFTSVILQDISRRTNASEWPIQVLTCARWAFSRIQCTLIDIWKERKTTAIISNMLSPQICCRGCFTLDSIKLMVEPSRSRNVFIHLSSFSSASYNDNTLTVLSDLPHFSLNIVFSRFVALSFFDPKRKYSPTQVLPSRATS